jgi:hypothetical protein
LPAKRELIVPKGDKRYMRRDPEGRFKESDDVGRSLSADRRTKAKTEAKSGRGDKRRSQTQRVSRYRQSSVPLAPVLD